jgi:hypothetical protein
VVNIPEHCLSLSVRIERIALSANKNNHIRRHTIAMVRSRIFGGIEKKENVLLLLKTKVRTGLHHTVMCIHENIEFTFFNVMITIEVVIVSI